MGTYQLQELIGGHSGAENYKISQDGADFMLKIFPIDFNPNKVAAIPAICRLYASLNIDSLQCYKTGKLNTTNQYFCIYNYIEGKNLEVIGESEYSPAENYHLGELVGGWLKALKAATPPPTAKLEVADIAPLTSHTNKLYQTLRADPQTRSLLSSYFDLDQLDYLLERFNQASQIFRNQPKHLIHGDIKRSNFMRDQAGTIYIIDIESMKYGYDILNFRHQMIWLLRPDRLKRMQFLRGVLDGLYHHGRPEHFNEQVLYIYTLNFIEHLRSVLDKKPHEAPEYLEMIQRGVSLILNPTGNII